MRLYIHWLNCNIHIEAIYRQSFHQALHFCFFKIESCSWIVVAGIFINTSKKKKDLNAWTLRSFFGPLCAIRHGSYLCIYYTKMILMSILNINLLLDPRILRHRQSHLDHFRDLKKMVGIYHHLLESSEFYEDDISASFSTRGASAERRKSM